MKLRQKKKPIKTILNIIYNNNQTKMILHIFVFKNKPDKTSSNKVTKCHVLITNNSFMTEMIVILFNRLTSVNTYKENYRSLFHMINVLNI